MLWQHKIQTNWRICCFLHLGDIFKKKTKHALKTETKNKNLKLLRENIIIKLEIFEFNKQNEMKQK